MGGEAASAVLGSSGFLSESVFFLFVSFDFTATAIGFSPFKITVLTCLFAKFKANIY
jgi:hypothetical protein